MSKSQLPSITEAICTFARLVRELLSTEAAIQLVTTLKALFDPVRSRLLSVVASHEGGEACVCDIFSTIDLSQPTISHHLKVLCSARLLRSQRRGTLVYHRVNHRVLQQLSLLLETDTPSPATRA